MFLSLMIKYLYTLTFGLALIISPVKLAFAQIDTGERILLLTQSNGHGADIITSTFLAGGDSSCDNMAFQIASAAAAKNHSVEPMRCLDIAGRARYLVLCKLEVGARTVAYSPPGQAVCKRQELDAQP